MIMGEGSLTPKSVVWKVEQSALSLASEKGSAYVEVTMGRVA
jgi:hypothetical protein